jgi:hypothetical protein
MEVVEKIQLIYENVFYPAIFQILQNWIAMVITPLYAEIMKYIYILPVYFTL